MKWISIYFLLTFSFLSHAAHIIGGEMTYRCIEEGKYEFTMILYRDCNGNGAAFDSGSGAPFPATITVYKEEELFEILNLDAPIIEDISEGNQIPQFQPPANSCVEKGTYIFELDLPVDASYNIAYQRCCYNNAITNIFDSNLIGITVATQIPNTPSCNSSPVFSKVPQYFLNAQFPFSIDLSAIDLDGDSLAYELCSPLIGGGPNTSNFDAAFGVAPNPDTNRPYDTLGFVTGLNSQQPFPSDPQLTINDSTGILTGNATILGNFLLAVCVKEFRGSNLIGTTIRQFQINISNEAVNTSELLKNSVNLFPNPSQEYVNVYFNDELIIEYYRIIDARGHIVRQAEFRNELIQVKNLAKGFYFVELQTLKGRIVKKLLKN